LKNRIHATLMTFGHPVSVADLFGVAGRQLLAGFARYEATPGPVALWERGHLRLKPRRGGAHQT
jgi:hypothetical protein